MFCADKHRRGVAEEEKIKSGEGWRHEEGGGCRRYEGQGEPRAWRTRATHRSIEMETVDPGWREERRGGKGSG